MTNQDGNCPYNIVGTNPHRGSSVKNYQEHYPKSIVFSLFKKKLPGKGWFGWEKNIRKVFLFGYKHGNLCM